MPVVSAGDLTLLRSENHRSKFRVSFLVPPILWEARINDLSIVKGETAIVFDTGSGSFFSMIEALQEVWVGTALESDDIGRLRVKSIASGDAGVTGTVTVAGHSHQLQDGQFLTFLHDYPLKPRRSYINPSTEVWNMDDDIVYPGEDESQPPVVIAGGDRAGFIDPISADWVINVDASASYAMSGTVSSYGLTVASTAGSPTVNFSSVTGLGDITFTVAGYYWAKYTVTDSNAQTQVSYRLYYVHDPDKSAGSYPFIDCERITLENDWENGGWIAGIKAQDDMTFSDIPDHTSCLVWGETIYGSTESQITFLDDNSTTVFAGFVRSDSDARDWATGVGEIDFSMSTIEGVLRQIHSFSTSLLADSGTPNKWYEGKSAQKMIDIVHNLWRWRTTLYERADVLWEANNTLLRAFGGLDEGNPYDMANVFLYDEGIRAKVLCDQAGRIHIVDDQQLMVDADRTAITTAFDISTLPQAADYGGLMAIPRKPEFEVPFVTGNGIFWDGSFDGDGKPVGDDFCSIAPGGKPLWRGSSPQDKPKQTVSSQDHLNKVTGRWEAKINNPVEEFRIQLHGNYLGVFDCAYLQDYTTDLQASQNPRGITWSDKPLYLRNVRAVYDGNTGSWDVNCSFEPEHITTDGVFTDCPSFPPLGGELPVIPIPAAAPGALLTGASVNYKGAQTDLWIQRLTQDVKDLIQDPFWRTRQATTSPSSAIVFRSGLGYIKRSTDGFDTVDVNVTPGTNPPNDAGDSPSPTRLNVTYTMIEGSYATQGRFSAIATWQNGSSEWRSWLAYTTNDGTSWSWGYLGEIACPDPCLNPTQTETANTDPPAANPQFQQGDHSIVEIDTDKYVWVYIALDGTYTAQVFEVNPATGVFTWGATYDFVDSFIDLHTYNVLHVAFIATDKFAVWHDAHYQYTPPFGDKFMYVTVCTVSSVTISSHTNNLVVTDFEAETYDTGIVGSLFRHRYGDIWSDGGTNVYVTTFMKPLASDCSTTSTYELVTLAGSLSGETITWATTTCTNGGTNTVSDWQTVDSAVGPAPEAIEVIDANGGTHAILVYDDDDSDDLRVRAFTSGSYGASVALPSSSTTGGDYDEYFLIRLSDTLSIFAANWVDFGAGDDTVHLWALSRSGTTMTAGTRFVLNDLDWGAEITRLTNSTFILVGWAADNDCDCDAAWKFSVSGTTISLTENCDYWHENSANTALTLAPDAQSSTDIIATARKDYSVSTTWPGLYIDVTSFAGCPTTATEIRAMGLSMAKLTGVYAWVTAGNDTNLELLRVTVSSMAITRYSLGNATMAQIDADTYLAYPFVPFGFDTAVYIYGRMNDPQSLGTPAHVIRTLTGGASWELVEDGWGVDWCGSLLISTSGYMFAVRSRDFQAKLYRDNNDNNLILKVTLPFSAPVKPHGMTVNHFTGEIYLGAGLADSQMVFQVPFPYFLPVDITFDHDNTEGIESVVLL